MNPIIIDDVANSVFKLRMYPYFDIANYILMSISVKEDTPQSGSVSFSRRHPFSCWLATMLMCFGGAILSNFITGSPLFECFDDTISVLTATVVCTTKISLLAAIAYYCHHLDIIPLPENQLFLVIMILFVYLRITMILLGLKDPFVPFENAVCKVLFGGTVDAIRSAFERSRSKASETTPSNLSNVSGTTSSSSTANMTGNANFSSTGTGTGQTNQGLSNSNANSFNSSGLRDAANRQTPSSGDKKRD
ncbi:unnamed protein product [Schistosoma rodhaini]|uniref:Transmembrane protein n=1 Tax=Schistosoma rodhaini TaxID=6188 RepID=A0AA85EM17_9TREM|nr:unnamed protein product [Schistosoma rodhaini]